MADQVIKKTKDYDKFQVFKFNRPVSEGLVKRLMESIGKIGYIDGKPILVDKDYAIIDGQHRYTACMRLGLEIPYVIVKGDVHETIINLNSQQVNWKMNDFIHSWAEQGVKCYQKLEEFEQKYKFGITNSLLVFFDNHFDGQDIKKIKAGHKFTINPDADKICEFILSCKDVPYYKSSYFIKAVVRLFKVATDKQLEKVKAGIISLPQQATAANYLVAFENIVNRGVMAKNRVSFKASVIQ